MAKDKRESILTQTEWYPNFSFLTSSQYFVCEQGSNKGIKIAGHLVSLVLGYMWYRSNGKDQICNTALPTTARDLGMSVNTVKRAIEILEKLGIVQDSGHITQYGTHSYWVFESKILDLHDSYKQGKSNESNNK